MKYVDIVIAKRWIRPVGAATLAAVVLIHLIAFPLLKQLAVAPLL